jgi:hypothetical protein
MRDCCLVVATTDNYVPYTNALLNSIQKRRLHEKCDLTVYLLYHDLGKLGHYPAMARERLGFRVEPIEVLRSDVAHPPETKRIEFIKRARFKLIQEIGMRHDLTCLMDADMFLVSDEFVNLYELAADSRLLVGCNEAFKWVIGDTYSYHGQPLFPQPVKLHKMHCSVPIVFDMHQWQDVFAYYNDICFEGRQVRPDGTVSGIGDIFCWNIAVYKLNRQRDVVLFPMETMTQVHQTNCHPGTELQVDNGYWFTRAGDPVYSVHGRVANENWLDGHLDRFEEDMQKDGAAGRVPKHKARIEAGLRAVVNEWHELNEKCALPLADVMAAVKDPEPATC